MSHHQYGGGGGAASGGGGGHWGRGGWKSHGGCGSQRDGRRQDIDSGSGNWGEDWGRPRDFPDQRQGYHAVDRYGGGGGRRRRGRGRSRDRQDRRDTHRVPQFPREDGEDDGSGGRERPPPGLRGREIGMWYARRSQGRKQQQEKMNRPTVQMDRARENRIRTLLDNLQDGEASSDDHRGSRPSTSGGAKSKNPHSDSGFLDSSMSAVSVKKECKEPPPFGAPAVSGSKAGFPQHQPFQSEAEQDPPDSWEDRDDDNDDAEMQESSQPFEVQVVAPEVRSSSSMSQEDRPTSSMPQDHEPDADMDDEDLNSVPSVAGVVQYMRSHGDYPYVDEEPDTDFTMTVPESDNPTLDYEMAERMRDLEQHPKFVNMLEFRKKLPSYEMRQTIVDAVWNNQVLVISGETGCGKTTQVPQFILDDYIERGIGSQCRIICTQPRRISAISVAERVGAERCETVDDTGASAVGYQIRLETKRPRSQGSILFCTTGIVLKFLESDPRLMRATHVIIDEIHERDLQSDFLMIILKDLLPLRPQLKVILMSATLNAEMFSQYFNECPMLNIPGFTFPVTEYLLEDIIEMTSYRPDNAPRPGFQPRRGRKRRRPEDVEEEENYRVWCNNLVDRFDQRTVDVLRNFDFDQIDLNLIHRIVHHICTRMDDGAILIFVPGWEEIKKLHEMIQKSSESRTGSLRVIPLHSLMPTVNQREVFERPPPGVRKIVIATNIAETSITIGDVVFVIDCGKIKVKDFKPEMNLTSLEPQWVSKANSKQRRGRAGRVQPGHCFHLYTQFHFAQCRDYLPPEMLRTRLEELCLQIKLLKLGRIVPFISKAMQHPSAEAITHAVNTLTDLNALDHNENLLPLGYHLARMPVEPHTGKMILFGAMFCCLDPILTVAASLSFKDAFTIPLGKEELADQARRRLSQGSKSDHIMLINAYKGWERSLRSGENRSYCWDHFLSENTLRMLKDMKKQLAELLHDIGFVASRDAKDPRSNRHSENHGLIRAVLCAGLYPNVAMITKVPKPKMANFKGIGMEIKDKTRVAAHPKSVNMKESFFESKWMVYYHMLKTSKVYIHDSTMVSPYPLLFFGGDINILREDKTELVSVDDWVVFKASSSTAQLVKDLRQQLDKLLTKKIRHPGPTTWDVDSPEGALMMAILDLITTEDRGRHDKTGSIGYPPNDRDRSR